MTADEQSKLKKPLIAAREGQAKEKAKQDSLRAQPAKPFGRRLALNETTPAVSDPGPLPARDGRGDRGRGTLKNTVFLIHEREC
jgi:hypothetical protein